MYFKPKAQKNVSANNCHLEVRYHAIVVCMHKNVNGRYTTIVAFFCGVSKQEGLVLH